MRLSRDCRCGSGKRCGLWGCHDRAGSHCDSPFRCDARTTGYDPRSGSDCDCSCRCGRWAKRCGWCCRCDAPESDCGCDSPGLGCGCSCRCAPPAKRCHCPCRRDASCGRGNASGLDDGGPVTDCRFPGDEDCGCATDAACGPDCASGCGSGLNRASTELVRQLLDLG